MNDKVQNSLQSEYEERKDKIKRLLESGIEPYPSETNRTHQIKEVFEKFDVLNQKGTQVTIIGRIRSKRVHGNLSFVDLEDASGRFQVAINKKELFESETYKKFEKLIDIGDFVEFTGNVFITKAGQKTLLTKKWILASKALRSMPAEHFGLKDEDERFRKRYIDLMLNEDLRKLFIRRSKFWRAIREFMENNDFLEVETPTIEATTGGAEARPFATHHNDFDLDVYMRICIGELWQKRLMASGFEKTFEIGRAYRNEGSSPNHMQEFTNMEFYWAYANYEDGMKLTQQLYKYIAHKVYNKTKFEARGHVFDLSGEWKKIDYVEEVERQTGVNVTLASDEILIQKLDELGIKYDGANKERYVDSLWKYCRANIAGPVFLVGHPEFTSPLSKKMKNSPEQVERFQIILAGAEVGNGYSELNDPIDQRERFKKQQKLLEEGDEEAMMPDWEFVEMLEYGMPPTCGFGVGERLFAFFENKTLREATLFPFMKPKLPEKVSQDNKSKKEVCEKNRFSEDEELLITLEQANELVEKYISDPVLKLHSKESQAIMKELAKHFHKDEKEVEKWGIIGLLHDLDWDMTKTNPELHSIKTGEILKEFGASEFLIETIKSHNYGYKSSVELKDKKRSSRIEHALASAETLTGLIIASALILPSKTVLDLKLKSLKKKFKNMKFAKNCDRGIIMECEKIGLSIDDFLEIGLVSLQKVAKELNI